VTIWHSACWVTKATDTHAECVTLIALSTTKTFTRTCLNAASEFFARLYNSEFQHSEDMQNAVLELNAECFAKYEQIFQRNLCAYLPIYTILLITTIIIQTHT